MADMLEQLSSATGRASGMQRGDPSPLLSPGEMHQPFYAQPCAPQGNTDILEEQEDEKCLLRGGKGERLFPGIPRPRTRGNGQNWNSNISKKNNKLM